MIKFLKYSPILIIISLLAISFSLYSIVRFGFKFGIDFTGGSLWEINLPASNSQPEIQSFFKSNNLDIYSANSTSNQSLILKTVPIEPAEKVALEQKLLNQNPNFKVLRFESQGPSLGKELIQKTIVGAILAGLAILLYVANAFKDIRFGLGAVIAMIHDIIILTGAFSLFGHLFGAQVDSLFVTALLTTLSASVHDTVVTFDRMRELRQQNLNQSWVEITNLALSQTIVRSLNNSMTIIIMLTSLVALGASATRWFGAALLVGAISGTYSSFAIAVPLVVYLKTRK